jgi:hypothetical protein
MSAIESPFLESSVLDEAVARPVLTVVADEVADCALGVEKLGSRIVGLSARLAASLCRWLLLIAEFDAREGARGSGWARPRGGWRITAG